MEWHLTDCVMTCSTAAFTTLSSSCTAHLLPVVVVHHLWEQDVVVPETPLDAEEHLAGTFVYNALLELLVGFIIGLFLLLDSVIVMLLYKKIVEYMKQDCPAIAAPENKFFLSLTTTTSTTNMKYYIKIITIQVFSFINHLLFIPLPFWTLNCVCLTYISE